MTDFYSGDGGAGVAVQLYRREAFRPVVLDEGDAGDELGSWLSKHTGIHVKIGGSVGRVLNNAGNAVTKAATDVGHVVGKVASNPIVQGVTAAALTLTGVGAPAAAAILAAEKGGGAILKPHGNIGQAARGVVTGALEGGGSALVGRALSAVPGVASVEHTFAQLPGVSTVAQLARRIKTPDVGTPAEPPALKLVAESMPGTDVPAPSVTPAAAPAAPAIAAPVTHTEGGNVSGTLLQHLLGTKRGAVVQEASNVATGRGATTPELAAATAPVAALVQRVAAPLATIAAATAAAPPAGTSPTTVAQLQEAAAGAPSLSDRVKANPVPYVAGAGAVVGLVLLLRGGRR